MNEHWKTIPDFPEYDVSNFGNIRSNKSGRILSVSPNQFGVVQVGLMKNGVQYHRSVPLLVAKAFLPIKPGPFDTPINLDSDRSNNHIDNLVWRPRWFAIKYNRQFRYPPERHISRPIVDLKTGEVSSNSTDCAKRYGLLEEEIVIAIANKTYVWPTYQEFRVVSNGDER
jgi:NUMOD4 motif